MPTGTDIADKLRQWRATYRLTQREAARYLCVSPRTLQAWEAGRGVACAALVLRLITHNPQELEEFLKLCQDVAQAFVT